MKQEKFSLAKRIQSFKYAFNGLKILVIEEHNARIHLLGALLAVLFGVLLEITVYEWMAVVFAIGIVIASELFNSSIENVADFLTKEKNNDIKRIKDLAAAGVLVSAMTALAIGLIIFIPKLINVCLKNY